MSEIISNSSSSKSARGPESNLMNEENDMAALILGTENEENKALGYLDETFTMSETEKRRNGGSRISSLSNPLQLSSDT